METKNTPHGTITDNNHAALWHGRFAEGPDAAAVEFETSIHVDERMALDDIHGSMAHAAMLCKQGIISEEENKAIQEGLSSIEKDLQSGALAIDYSAEDIHSFVDLPEWLQEAIKLIFKDKLQFLTSGSF